MDMSNYSDRLSTSFMDTFISTLPKLKNIWNEVGYSALEQNMKMEELKDLIKKFMDNEDKIKNLLLIKIRDEGKELFNLSKSLGEYREDLFDDDGVTLIETEKRILQNLLCMKALVTERQEQLADLMKNEQELCEQLIEDPTEASGNEVPSLDELSDIQRRINTLEQEKAHRQNIFKNLKSDIRSLMEEINVIICPNRVIECAVNQREELFTLSLHNLEYLRTYKRDLTMKAKANKEKLDSLKYEVCQLWDRLQINVDEQEEFVATLSHVIPIRIEMYLYELNKLEELKKANMADIIGQLKKELDHLWEKCYTSDDDKNMCQAYYCDENTEAIMLSLEDEVKKLTNGYQSAITIYDLVHKRKKLMTTLVDLEEKSYDPSRLFKNRGGGLLLEERERNKIKADLPRVEAELKDRVEEWQLSQSASQGIPIFTIKGLTLADYIERDWDQYHERKMVESKDRQNARTAQLHQNSRLGPRLPPSSAMCSLRSNNPINSNILRKTASFQPSLNKPVTRRAALAEQNPNVPGPSRMEARDPSRTSKRQRDSQDQMTSTRNNKRLKEDKSDDEVVSYTRFAESILLRSEGEQMRSSVLHSPSTPRHRHTPLQPPQTIPRNFRFARTTTNNATNRLLPPTTPKRTATPGMSAAFATPSRFKTPNSKIATTPYSVVRNTTSSRIQNSSRSMPRRRSGRLNPSRSQSRLGSYNGGSTLKLTSPAQNRLRFLI